MTEQTPNASTLNGRGKGVGEGPGPVPLGSLLAKIKPRPGALNTVVTEKCHYCHDQQFFRYGGEPGDPNFGDLYRCPFCNAGNDPKTLHRLSGLSKDEQQWRLTDLDTEGLPAMGRLVQACRDLITGRRYILTVWGACGNGKTLALQAMVNEMAERGVPAIYYTTKQMLDHLRAAMDTSSSGRNEGVQARMKRLESIPFLALDEFDKVSPTDWAMEQLTYLIDQRHRGSEAGTHATMIAMNEDPELQMPWIASRLMAGNNRVVHNTGGDLRRLLPG